MFNEHFRFIGREPMFGRPHVFTVTVRTVGRSGLSATFESVALALAPSTIAITRAQLAALRARAAAGSDLRKAT